MLFYYTTPEFNMSKGLGTVKKIRAHLRSGIAEIYEDHQNLIGKITNNLIEIESTEETRIGNNIFFVQDGVFLVSRKGLEFGNKSTTAYLYALNVKEIRNDISISNVEKELEEKNVELRKVESFFYELNQEDENYESQKTSINSKIFVLRNEIIFLEKYLQMLRTYKNS